MATQRRTQAVFFAGVPFDNENVLYLGKYAVQEIYIAEILKYMVYESEATLSYQRDNMYMRLNLKTHQDIYELNQANYMVYINVGHETRWRFCRITHIEYINDMCVHVHFELDYWHTYADRLKITGGYIEREHYLSESNFTTNAMRIENLSVGEPVVYKRYDAPLYREGYVVNFVKDRDGQMLNPLYDKLPQDESYYNSTLPVLDSAEPKIFTDLYIMNEFLAHYIDHPEAIAEIIVTPLPAYDNMVIDIDYPPKDLPGQIQRPWSKCFKYPNMYIKVTNGLGDEKIYYPELFIADTTTGAPAKPSFRLTCSYLNGLPTVRLMPLNYKGVAENVIESIYYDQFPRLRWEGDSFGNWWTTNSIKSVMQTVGSLAATAGAIALAPATAGTSIAAIGAGVGMANLGANIYSQSKQDDRSYGSATYGGARNYMTGDYPGFKIDIMGAYHGIIMANNNFWNSYGYFKGNAGIPNLDKNPYWNYVKGVVNFEYFGNSEANNTIKGMFANGVRLWHSGAVFGDLLQDNRG